MSRTRHDQAGGRPRPGRALRSSAPRTAAIILVCVVFALPLVVMVTGSLRMPGLPPPDGIELVPREATTMTYEVVRSVVPLTTQLRNSLLVALVAVPVSVVIASLAGFSIVVADRTWRRFLLAVSAAALLIPASALWVPRFVLFRWTGLLDSLAVLMTPALMATSPLYVLLFAYAYSRIPKALFEAARLEGLSAVATWRTVAWPLARGTTFAVAVLTFAWHWANFIDPLLYLSSTELFTLPLGLRALSLLEPANRSIALAGAVIATLPVVIAFVLAQRSLFKKALAL